MAAYLQSRQLASSGTMVSLAFNNPTGAGHALVVAGRIAADRSNRWLHG